MFKEFIQEKWNSIETRKVVTFFSFWSGNPIEEGRVKNIFIKFHYNFMSFNFKLSLLEIIYSTIFNSVTLLEFISRGEILNIILTDSLRN